MPRVFDEAHAYFETTVESYVNDDGAQKSRKRVRCCNPGCEFVAVFRNVDQLVNHLADAGAGAGFMTGCKMVPAEVRDKFRKRQDEKSRNMKVPSAEVVEKSMHNSNPKKAKSKTQSKQPMEAILSDLKKSEEEVLDALRRWAFGHGLDPAIFSGELWDKAFRAIRNAPPSMKPPQADAMKVVFDRLSQLGGNDSAISDEALSGSSAALAFSAAAIPMEVPIPVVAPKQEVSAKRIRTHEV